MNRALRELGSHRAAPTSTGTISHMSAPWLMVLASLLLFATMGVCISSPPPTTPPARSSSAAWSGLAMMTRWRAGEGGTLRTAVPAMHFWRSISGVTALCLWFYAIGNLPLPTAMTLNYMSSVWMALFLVGGAIMLGSQRVDGQLWSPPSWPGFAGVALVCALACSNQAWHGLVGLLSACCRPPPTCR